MSSNLKPGSLWLNECWWSQVCSKFTPTLFEVKVISDQLSCRGFKLAHNSLRYLQMRLKRHPARQLRTPGASANKVPSAFQIRPVKSANAVPSECRLLSVWNGLQPLSLPPRWPPTLYCLHFWLDMVVKTLLFGEATKHTWEMLAGEADIHITTLFLYVLPLLETFYFSITAGVNQVKRRWRSAPPSLTQCAENGIHLLKLLQHVPSRLLLLQQASVMFTLNFKNCPTWI